MVSPSGAILFEAPAPLPLEQVWAWQRLLQARLLAPAVANAMANTVAEAVAEAVLLVEHTPCYTLGRGASLAHLRFDPHDPPLPLHRIDRGGEVTHHLPGQLVLYPVLDLSRHGADLHHYLRQLEGVVLDVLEALGLAGERCPGLTGVWLEGRKVAAIGVGARRWISQHGLALNVDCPMEGFGAIVPCGLADRPVGRLCDWCPGLTAAAVRPLLRQAFAARFGLVLRPPQPAEQLPEW